MFFVTAYFLKTLVFYTNIVTKIYKHVQDERTLCNFVRGAVRDAAIHKTERYGKIISNSLCFTIVICMVVCDFGEWREMQRAGLKQFFKFGIFYH